MSAPPDPNEIDARLEGIAQAQRRARWAILLGTIASGAILTTLWNSYLSWDRRLAAQFAEGPSGWGRQVLMAEQIRSWIETNTVTVSLLGIRASVSDAAVLGSLALLVCSFYACMALRQENEEVGSLLRDASSAYSTHERRSLFRRMHAVIFVSRTETAAPFASLDSAPVAGPGIPLSRVVIRVLTYLPAMTIAVIVLSDLYYATGYPSPFLANTTSVWYKLPLAYQRQLILMDTFGVLAGIVTFQYCRLSSRYRDGTRAILEQFDERSRGEG